MRIIYSLIRKRILDIYSRIARKIQISSKLNKLYKNLLDNISDEPSFVSALREVASFNNIKLFNNLNISFIKDNIENTRVIKKYSIRKITIYKEINLINSDQDSNLSSNIIQIFRVIVSRENRQKRLNFNLLLIALLQQIRKEANCEVL